MNPSKTKFFFIKTFGCTYNLADSLKIERILSTYHYIKVDDINLSNIIIINTCAVKHATETKILYYIQKQRNQYPDKQFIIIGCLPQIGRKMKQKIQNLLLENDFIVKPLEINKIPYLLDNSLKTDSLIPKSAIIPSKLKHQNVGIIQISEGCNNSCTYCCTTIARGKLISFDSCSILDQIKLQYLDGIDHFYLTSQDLGNYNYNGKNLIHLLRDILNLQGNFQIRLGMTNPDFLIKSIEEFLTIFQDHRIFRFLHIPIQSGSNNILKLMGRKYKIEEVRQIIQKIKEFDKNFTFSTDIIVGFPTEQEEDFQETVDFIKEWQPFNLNISKYSVRPNTLAKKMNQIPSQEIKRRSTILHEIYKDYSHQLRKNWIGWEGTAIISNFTSEKCNSLVRNAYNIPIFIEQQIEKKIIKIKIKKIKQNKLIGIYSKD